MSPVPEHHVRGSFDPWPTVAGAQSRRGCLPQAPNLTDGQIAQLEARLRLTPFGGDPLQRVAGDPDISFLIQTVFTPDDHFSLPGGEASAEDGIQMARSSEPGIIVLDHSLEGDLTGIQAAP